MPIVDDYQPEPTTRAAMFPAQTADDSGFDASLTDFDAVAPSALTAASNQAAGDEAKQKDAQPEMTPEQRQAAIEEVLAKDADEGVDMRTLIFDFGPFAEMERRIREMAAETVSPQIADAAVSHVRQAIHDVVVARPQLGDSDRTQPGLTARLGAINDILSRLEPNSSATSGLLGKLKGLGATGVEQLRAGIIGQVKLEEQQLKSKVESLAPRTLGLAIFDSLRDATRRKPSQLVGDARRVRNAQLVKALGSLQEVAAELKENAGNEQWERTQGAQSAKEVHNLRKRIEDLTDGVQDQVDSRDMKKALRAAEDILEEASQASLDPEQKSRLNAARESIQELMKRFMDAISKFFSQNKGGVASPRPA